MTLDADFILRKRAEEDAGLTDQAIRNLSTFGLRPDGSVDTSKIGDLAAPLARPPKTPKSNVEIGVRQSFVSLYRTASNSLDLMDRAAGKISQWTGMSKGGAFGLVRPWLEDRIKKLSITEEESVGKDSIPDYVIQGFAAAPMTIAQYAAASTVTGSGIVGMAINDAIRESDKGFLEALKAGAVGAGMGLGLKLLEPFSRPIRAAAAGVGAAGITAATGGDAKQSIASGITMAGLAAIPPAKPRVSESKVQVESKAAEKTEAPKTEKSMTPEDMLIEQYVRAQDIEAEAFIRQKHDIRQASRTPQGRDAVRQKLAADAEGLPSDSILRDIQKASESLPKDQKSAIEQMRQFYEDNLAREQGRYTRTEAERIVREIQPSIESEISKTKAQDRTSSLLDQAAKTVESPPLEGNPTLRAAAETIIKGSRGSVSPDLLYPVARSLAGAVYGAYQGDTLEERIQNALLFGAGAAVAPALVKKVIGMMRDADRSGVRAIDRADRNLSPQVEKGHAEITKHIKSTQAKAFEDFLGQHEGDIVIKGRERIPGINYDHINTAEDIKYTIGKVAKAVEDRVAEARRIDRDTGKGVSHERTALEAKALREAGFDEGAVMALEPGKPLDAAHLTAVRMINVDAAAKLRELQKRYEAQPSSENFDLFRDQFMRHGKILEVLTGASTGQARALESMRLDVGVDGNLTLIKERAGKIAEIAKTDVSPERFVEMVKELDASQQARFARQLRTHGFVDSMLRLWYGISLLSNPATLTVNALSTSLATAWAIPKRFIAATATELSGHRGDSRYVQMSEVPQMLFAIKHSYREAIEIAEHAFRTGERRYGGSEKYQAERTGLGVVEKRGFKSESLSQQLGISAGSRLSAPLDYLGMAADMFPRLMNGSDEFLKLVNERMELYARVARKAEDGISPRELADHARREIQANRLSPLEVEAARNEALFNTFNSKAGSLTSAIELGISRLRDENPMAYVATKAILPFLNIPINVTKWAIHNGPLAPLSLRFQKMLAEGGASAQLAMAEVTLGSIFLSVMAGAALEGWITGKGPLRYEDRKMWEADGNQSDSFVFPDGSHLSFARLDPLSLMAGWAADIVDISGHIGEADLMPVVGAMALAITRPLSEKNMIRGVVEGLKAFLSRDPRALYEWQRNFVAGLTPGLLRAFRQQVDPYRRQVDSMVEALANQTPWGSSDLAPDSDAFGRPILSGRGFGPAVVNAFGMFMPTAYRKKEQSDVIEEIARNKIQVQSPSAWLFGQGDNPFDLVPQDTRTGVHLKGWDYYYYKKLAGDKALEQLEKLIKTDGYIKATDGPDGGKALLIQSAINSSRQWARAKLLQEDDALRGQLEEKRAMRREALTIQ